MSTAASSRARDANPSAAAVCAKPRWVAKNSLDAATSSTVSDTVEAVICTGSPCGGAKFATDVIIVRSHLGCQQIFTTEVRLLHGNRDVGAPGVQEARDAPVDLRSRDPAVHRTGL